MELAPNATLHAFDHTRDRGPTHATAGMRILMEGGSLPQLDTLRRASGRAHALQQTSSRVLGDRYYTLWWTRAERRDRVLEHCSNSGSGGNTSRHNSCGLRLYNTDYYVTKDRDVRGITLGGSYPTEGGDMRSPTTAYERGVRHLRMEHPAQESSSGRNARGGDSCRRAPLPTIAPAAAVARRWAAQYTAAGAVRANTRAYSPADACARAGATASCNMLNKGDSASARTHQRQPMMRFGPAEQQECVPMLAAAPVTGAPARPAAAARCSNGGMVEEWGLWKARQGIRKRVPVDEARPGK
eukprot:gene13886-biopygen12128